MSPSITHLLLHCKLNVTAWNSASSTLLAAVLGLRAGGKGGDGKQAMTNEQPISYNSGSSSKRRGGGGGGGGGGGSTSKDQVLVACTKDPISRTSTGVVVGCDLVMDEAA